MADLSPPSPSDRPDASWPGRARPAPGRAAGRIALIYGVLAALWIALSDRVAATAFADPVTLTHVQTWKGWAFVAGSAWLIFVLVRREVRATTESEGRFEFLVEQSLAGVYVIAGGRFLYVNPHFAETFGYTVDECLALGAEDLVSPSDRDLVRENLRRRESGEMGAARYEFRGLRKGGQEIQVEVFGRRIELDGSAAVIGMLLDRTEARRLEDQMRQAQRMEAVGQLTGAVAHDFNNLLTAIIAPLDLVLEDGAGNGAFREEIRQVRETALRAASLTRKLLTFSRKQVDHPRMVDLNETVAGLRHMLENLLPPGVRLQIRTGALEERVRIDPSSLEQIILNLVVNGAEAMQSGGVLTVATRRVLVSADEPLHGPAGDPLAPGAHLCLEVSDTGHGMDEATRSRIFEPFFTTKERGTGLGLATVFGQARKAGGDVLVRSEPGRGTTFTVYLPARSEAPLARVTAEVRERETEGNERILVVDDEPQVGRVVTEALRRFGYRTALAASRAEAMEAARIGDGLDLLIADLVLPDGTGLDVARELSGLQSDLRVLFISGYSDEHMRDRLGGHGTESLLLEKPFDLTELRARVEASLAGPAWAGEGPGRAPEKRA